jgi:hypothetical protein
MLMVKQTMTLDFEAGYPVSSAASNAHKNP